MKFLVLLTLALPVFAGLTIDKNKDIQEIKKMTGCYAIKFQSAETFAYSNDYDFYDRYASGALEWIFVDSENENMVNLQHILVTPHAIVKHWRQQWDWEATNALDYRGFSNWDNKAVKNPQGNWVQRVYQVDDSPRYECSAPWIHTDKTSYWECTANAPLPRREFSKRSDYNVLRRTNRHEQTPYGHVHDQDNIKLDMLENGMQLKLAMEKSYNTYQRVDDSRCQPAIDWWKTHKYFWRDVVSVWDKELYSEDSVKIDFKKTGAPLWARLFELDEQMSTRPAYDSKESTQKIKTIIQNHILR
ncbi:DUF6607 family protein [Halobacteriovorax sp. ZH4_bin.1]|uniref:DUF6607 family protein n=1 Tax=unclassified Halobacteriovorax TaxID=2639665 RepID=UPI00371BFFED